MPPRGREADLDARRARRPPWLPGAGMNTLPSVSKLVGRRASRTPAAMAPRHSHPSAAKGSRSASVYAWG